MSIAIVSILKPVNDTRLYHKLACSLAENLEDWTIHLIGFQAQKKEISTPSNIQLYPLFNFPRLHWKRIFANVLIFRKLIKLKPKILIVATFEALPAALFFKMFFSCKLLYDVQENYYKNIIHTQVFPSIIKHILAYIVRLMERIAHPFIEKYLLAEACYFEEMPFVQKKSMLLTNKFILKNLKNIQISSANPQIQKFIYIGTISSDYGIFEAIRLIDALYSFQKQIHLTIIGFCPKESDWVLLEKLIQGKTYIQLIGGRNWVSHQAILQYIAESDAVLMPYHINPSVQNRIPTKFYECLALKKPMLIQKNKAWEDFFAKFSFQAAYFMDYSQIYNVNDTYQQIKQIRFYQEMEHIEGISWEDEEKKIIQLIKNCI